MLPDGGVDARWEEPSASVQEKNIFVKLKYFFPTKSKSQE